jgi:alpha-glucosidase
MILTRLAILLLPLLVCGAASGQDTSLESGRGVLPCGAFEVRGLDGEGEDLRVVHRASGKALWAAPPERSLLSAGVGRERIKQVRHSFTISDRTLRETEGQSVDCVEARAGGVDIRGALLGDDGLEVPYLLRFLPVDAQTLSFEVRLEPTRAGLVQGLAGGARPDRSPARRPNRLRLHLAGAFGERLYGLGAQFTHLDLKGHRVPIWAQEQGQGRGSQPISFFFNRLSPGLGGDAYSTYTAVPLLLSSRGTGLLVEDHPYMVFDMRNGLATQVEAFSTQLRGRLFVADDMPGLLEVATRSTGRMQPLPDWAHAGAIVGTVGGVEWVRELEARLAEHGVPVSGWFLQDWVGERKTAFGKRLVWNWIAEPKTYGDLSAFVAERQARGQRVMGYVNPFLVDVPGARRNLYAEAREAGYLVETRDGEPYAIGSGGFTAGLVDLTHPEARTWFKQVIQDEMLSQGLSGWMSDFCEQLPVDARLHAGDAAEVHNRYPELFQALQREAIEESGAREVVFFARSGTFRSPGITPLFWLGDQMTSWDRHDGLHSALIGQLSSGISGYTLTHADIGGYLSPQLVGISLGFKRSDELLIRWMELAAFSPVFRTHDANSTGVQFHSNETVLAHFARNAKLFRALFDYRKQLMQEAAGRGLPLTRPLWLHHPRDRLAPLVETQFLLGEDLLVAPVLEKGTDVRMVYLPQGEWIHLWSGERYTLDEGLEVGVECPLGQPPAFVRVPSRLAETLGRELRAAGVESRLP